MANSEKFMVPFLPVHLDRRQSATLQRQLYDQLRAVILAGSFAPGVRLPATRILAADLRVSRNTVAGAFDQLLAEGYLESRVGSGTYVARELPEDLLRVPGGRPAPYAQTDDDLRPSRRGQALAAIPVSLTRGEKPPHPFTPGIPALDRFPRDLWARLSARLVRHASAAALTYGDSIGYRPLRQAIADYLGAARSVRCSADQVIVTAGSQQALDLAARVLLDPGESAWVEDPGYLGARGAFRAANIRCVPVPVDAEGLNVEKGLARAPESRLAYITPSHQYPLGVTMSLPRRMQMLDWASRRRAWIVEDDVSSEYRYAGRPLAALQGLDSSNRVIYVGTFSKVLCPALRLGYLVVPESLVDAFVSARALADRHPPGLEQIVLAEFLAEGHFARHVRRMRSLYAERQHALLTAVQRELSDWLEVHPAEAGLDVVGWLPPEVNDRVISAHAAMAGITAPPISAYAVRTRPRPALRLGYAALSPRQIREGVRKLAGVLRATTPLAPRDSDRRALEQPEGA